MNDTATYDRNAQHSRILERENHVTAAITTVGNIRFIVMKRPDYTVVVREHDGRVFRGDIFEMRDKRIYLYTGSGRVMYTPDIVNVFILTN